MMKNEEITIYELMGLIKNNKAPKKIKYDNATFTFVDENYYSELHDVYLFNLINDCYSDFEMPNAIVEILPEENNEWIDIEEFEIVGCNVKIKIGDNETFIPTESLILDYVLSKENQLIKNQKYLKERLDGKVEN